MLVTRRSILVVSLMLGMVAFGAASALALGPGDAAPDFTLQDVNGTSYTLSDYRGKVVLLALIGYG